MSIVQKAAFGSTLVPIPATEADLTGLVAQFNKSHKTSYTQKQLDPLGLIMSPRAAPVNDLTPEGSLLTATSFVVANTSGSLATFACVEMDDAVIGKVCKANDIAFGFVRNVSDPVQNAELPSSIQGDWGSLVYEAYGFYSSYNGALAAWALIAA
jgi:nucleoside phosphorylase